MAKRQRPKYSTETKKKGKPRESKIREQRLLREQAKDDMLKRLHATSGTNPTGKGVRIITKRGDTGGKTN